MEAPAYRVYSRSTIPGSVGYKNYSQSTSSISSIGNIFPLVLYLVVAALGDLLPPWPALWMRSATSWGFTGALVTARVRLTKFVIYGLVASGRNPGRYPSWQCLPIPMIDTFIAFNRYYWPILTLLIHPGPSWPDLPSFQLSCQPIQWAQGELTNEPARFCKASHQLLVPGIPSWTLAPYLEETDLRKAKNSPQYLPPNCACLWPSLEWQAR